MNSRPSHEAFLDPPPAGFAASRGFARQNSGDDEHRRQISAIAFGGHDAGMAVSGDRQGLSNDQAFHASASRTASTSGSVPSSRNGTEQLSQYGALMQDKPRHSQFGPPTSTFLPSHRPSHSARTASYSSQTHNPKQDVFSGQLHEADLASGFGRIRLDDGADHAYPAMNGSAQFASQAPYDFDYHRPISSGLGQVWGMGEGAVPNALDTLGPDGMGGRACAPPVNPYGNLHLHDREPSPAGLSDYRRLHSPYLSSGGTPPALADQVLNSARGAGGMAARSSYGQAALLERKLKGLQQEQQQAYPSPVNPLHFREPFGPNYGLGAPNNLRINPLTPYYPVAAVGAMPGPMIPRGPSRDQDAGQSLRSPLLEEFRSNNKTSKRYELKVEAHPSFPPPSGLGPC